MRISLFFLLALAACRQPAPPLSSERILSDTLRDASAVYMTQGDDGRTVVSWISDGRLWYSVSADSGQSFDAARAIPGTADIPSHGENMPKVIVRPDGAMVAMYGVEADDPRNKYAGRIFYTASADGGAHWQEPAPLVADTAGYDQRYFDLTLLPSGGIAAVWLDNRESKEQEGSSLYMAVAGPGLRFERERRLAESVCPCCRTALYTDPQGVVHVAFRGIFQDTIRDMAHMLSRDGGVTFTRPARISADNWVINGCPHTGPALVRNAVGLHFAWFTMGTGEGVFYCRSYDDGITYTAKETICPGPMAKHPQLTTTERGDVAIVWDEAATGERSRIGLQHRTPEGRALSTVYITPEGGHASFPVLRPAGNGAVLIAYKKKENGKERIGIQRVVL